MTCEPCPCQSRFFCQSSLSRLSQASAIAAEAIMLASEHVRHCFCDEAKEVRPDASRHALETGGAFAGIH